MNVAKGQIRRNAQNFRIQGTAANMTKLAAVMFRDTLKKQKLSQEVYIVNMVHDEIVVEASKHLETGATELLLDCMTNAGKTFCKKVEMPADGGPCKFWSH